VHVPKKCIQKQKPIPLVFVLPFTYQVNRPFLESDWVAEFHRVNQYRYIADKYNVAYAFPGSRIYNKFNEYPISNTATFEVLQSLKEDYNIDEDRVYLIGYCGSARTALFYASRFPSVFAGVAVVGPAFQFSDSKTSFMSSQLPPEWLQANNPLNFIDNFRNIPTYIMHADNDQAAPVEYTIDFFEKVKNMGFEIDIEILKGVSKGYGYDLYPYKKCEKLFSFLSEKKRDKSPARVTFSTMQLKYNTAYWLKLNRFMTNNKASIDAVYKPNNTIDVKADNILQYEILLSDLHYDKKTPLKITTNEKLSYEGIPDGKSLIIDVNPQVKSTNGTIYKTNEIEGPVNHAFAGKFMVVEGTSGNPVERRNIRRVVDEFRQKWRESYWGDCLYKQDIAIDSTDIADNHLILFGDQKTNLLINKIMAYLPFKIGQGYIKVREDKYTGQHLGIQLIYPNPLNPAKYVVILSGTNIDDFQIGDSELSLNGWHDYTVWEFFNVNDVTLSRKIGYGNFNQLWH